MDISEIWPFLKALLFPVGGWTMLLFAKRIKARCMRLLIKTVASGIVALGTIALLLLLLFEAACSKRASPIYSPDGQHVVLLRYALQGALGDDYAVVGLRPWWRPYTDTVYSGLGRWDFVKNSPDAPEVHWLDRTHLLIRYFDDRTGNEGRGGPATCRTRIGRIEIICQSVPFVAR
jgi:hypothetical protein